MRTPVRITHALLGEHGAIYPLLDAVESGAAEASLEGVRLQARMLEAALISHACIEDEVLRPAIETFLPGAEGPTDHEVIAEGLESALAAGDADEARRRLLETVARTRQHFEKEETVIFGIAERALSTEAQERLGAWWAARRNLRA